MTPRRTQSTAGKATREQIIAVTLQAIQQEGLAALTIRQIADRAGVNVAAVNYHFGSKDALVGEVLGELLGADLHGDDPRQSAGTEASRRSTCAAMSFCIERYSASSSCSLASAALSL